MARRGRQTKGKDQKSTEVLTRDQFRKAVFDRDGGLCVFCAGPAVDAHHIIERRLWTDSGYYINNGASVCGDCHLKCEMTLISAEDCRLACGIKQVLLPPHLDQNREYDKWGNPILKSGVRLKGELFYDEGVQKILKRGGVLNQFM